jgi:hypothetical protein
MTQHDHHMRHYRHHNICGDDSTPEYWGELSKDVSNFRKLARHGLADLSRMSRRGYGAAVLVAIAYKQRAALKRETPEHKCECASGTNHNTGKSILAAIKKANAARLYRQATFNQVVASEKYETAMTEKRARITALN